MTAQKTTFYYGEESFLVEEALQKKISLLTGYSKTLLAEKATWQDLFNHINAMSLFEDNKCLVWKNPWFLSTTLSKEDAKQLEALLPSVENSDHQLIIYTTKKLDQRKKGVSFLKKQATSIEFQAFKDWEQDKVMNWLDTRISALGLSIDQNALMTLTELGGTNLRHLAGELDKIAVYLGEKTHISLQDILAIGSGVNTGIYQLNEAMKIGDFKSILGQASALMDHGEDPIKLMGLVTANFRFYLQLLSLLPDHSFQDIGKILGKNPYFVKRLISPLQKAYTLSQCYKAVGVLAEKDLQIKSGKCQSRTALETGLVSIYQSN